VSLSYFFHLFENLFDTGFSGCTLTSGKTKHIQKNFVMVQVDHHRLTDCEL
jgi:hypothetical protein